MKYLISILIVLLLVLHQDYWQWDDASLDFGFLPRALTYHIGISIASAVVWWLATRYCWPERLEQELAEREGAGS